MLWKLPKEKLKEKTKDEKANEYKAIHIRNSLQPTLRQKLQKSMSLPTLQAERKIKYENTITSLRAARRAKHEDSVD